MRLPHTLIIIVAVFAVIAVAYVAGTTLKGLLGVYP